MLAVLGKRAVSHTIFLFGLSHLICFWDGPENKPRTHWCNFLQEQNILQPPVLGRRAAIALVELHLLPFCAVSCTILIWKRFLTVTWCRSPSQQEENS